MKRITTATILSAFAALALGAGCKGSSSSSTTTEPSTTERADRGPLLPPPAPGLGAAGGPAGGDTAAPPVPGDGPLGPADRAAIRARQGDLQPRAWVDGAELTDEQKQARRAEREEQREARRQELLATHDADRDGQLSPEERKAMRAARLGEMHGRLDSDGDGQVSRTEIEAMNGAGRRPGPQFDSLDANGDGYLSVDEMNRMRPQRGPRPDPHRGENRGWGEQVPAGGTPDAPGAPAPQ